MSTQKTKAVKKPKAVNEAKLSPRVELPMTWDRMRNIVLGDESAMLRMHDIDFLRAVVAELVRARGKFPSPIHSFAALVEEVGEVGKALISEPAECVVAEAVQTAVMAIRCGVEGDASFAVYRDMKQL